MSCKFFHSQVRSACLSCAWWWCGWCGSWGGESGWGGKGEGGDFQGRFFVGKATWNIVFCLEGGRGGVFWLILFFFHIFAFFVIYLQLQDPECLTSSSAPIEQAACFMAHSLGYVVLSLAHTASSVLLSGQVSSHSEQRPRLIRASHRHFFPALHWMSSHDLASAEREEENRHRGNLWLGGLSQTLFKQDQMTVAFWRVKTKSCFIGSGSCGRPQKVMF